MNKIERRQLDYLAVIMAILTIMLIGMLLTGCSGPKGDIGYTGATGAQGPQGNIGPHGPQGNPGMPGLNAQPCTAFKTNGIATITCPGSAPVSIQDGQNGATGTVITLIQFCSGFTQSYPSTFAEYGLCIDNQLYGVYSANGGFLALLPPGTYSSDGINSSCTFTIGNNCEISQ